ncbi:unnamed protein product, partial [Rotaria sordida]
MPTIRRSLDHQLTAMILVHITLFVITTLLYISFRIYQINNPVGGNYSYSVLLNKLIEIVLITIFHINYL